MANLKPFFKQYLPMRYEDVKFPRNRDAITAKEGVVRTLLLACCDTDSVRAIKTTFERTLGKPEKPVVIKRVHTRISYPRATQKLSAPNTAYSEDTDLPVAAGERELSVTETPSHEIRQMLDTIGDRPEKYIYEVLDNKEDYLLTEVMVANLYRLSLEADLSGIDLLLDYLDGAVADVVTVQTDDTILVENYSDVAPHNAVKGEDGVYYVDAN